MRYICTSGVHAGDEYVLDPNNHSGIVKLRRCGTGDILYRRREIFEKNFRALAPVSARKFYKEVFK